MSAADDRQPGARQPGRPPLNVACPCICTAPLVLLLAYSYLLPTCTVCQCCSLASQTTRCRTAASAGARHAAAAVAAAAAALYGQEAGVGGVQGGRPARVLPHPAQVAPARVQLRRPRKALLCALAVALAGVGGGARGAGRPSQLAVWRLVSCGVQPGTSCLCRGRWWAGRHTGRNVRLPLHLSSSAPPSPRPSPLPTPPPPGRRALQRTAHFCGPPPPWCAWPPPHRPSGTPAWRRAGGILRRAAHRGRQQRVRRCGEHPQVAAAAASSTLPLSFPLRCWRRAMLRPASAGAQPPPALPARPGARSAAVVKSASAAS